MAVLAVLLVALVSRGLSDGPLDSRSIAGNGTASVLVDRIPSLGIAFRAPARGPEDPEVPSFDQKARSAANPGGWLDAQIQLPDESIGEPPEALREYLQTRREAIWTIIAALERQPPEWVEPKDRAIMPFPYLLPSVVLQKVLLAVALVEERDGNRIGASRALEASWSLDRPLAERPLLIHQMISTSAQIWQAGALRKMAEPPLQWLGRLDNNDPWQRVLKSVAGESEWRDDSGSLPGSDPFTELSRRAPDAIAESLGKLPPCDAAALDDEDIWRFADREIPTSSATYAAEIRRMYKETFLPTTLGVIRRVARLSVDRELTLRILQLRLDKSSDPDGRWPERMANPISTICPAASYSYRSDMEGMEIRFQGFVVDPPAGSVLPLAFRSHYPRKKSEGTPTPAPPVLTPTPAGAMIAPK